MSTMLPMGPVATTVTGQTFQVMQPSTGNVYDLTAGTTTGQYVGVSASGVFGLMTFNPLQLTVVSSTTQTGALTAGAMLGFTEEELITIINQPIIIEYVKQNPKWKISLQVHKYMNIP